MPSPAVIIGIVVFCCLMSLGIVLGVYFSKVACPDFGSDCPAAATPPAGTPPAGTPPAGTPPAGSPSAGSPSAGTPPAGTPPAPAAYSLKDNTVAYRGDTGLAGKTLATVSGDVNACKSACDTRAECTHFERLGNSCTLYRGAEWVGGMPGGQSYCKSQCQT